MKAEHEVIGVVGLGYVGLPLAAEFAEVFDVVGYDVSPARVAEIKAGKDHTHEVAPAALRNPRLTCTSDPSELRRCTFIIVAVPTPVDQAKIPDMEAVRGATATVGRILARGMAVVYESTVYPGVTEEICLPILERESGLTLGDFGLGYSPERINPGDREHTVATIVKVVSGHDAGTLERVARVYGAVVKAGVHRAPNIKTAEASKVIENVQRDLNIALMNELSKIFARLGIHTDEVLAAAATKWNFHRYSPGLVGGHCIGVDPYYLTHRALELGYHPEVILAGRRINDSMGSYVGELTVRELNSAGMLPRGARVWILGLTFKENVPDLRNTRAADVVAYLWDYGVSMSAWEPLVPAEKISSTFGLPSVALDQAQGMDAVIVINRHDAFRSIDLRELRRKMRTPVLIDLKNLFARDEARRLGFRYLSL